MRVLLHKNDFIYTYFKTKTSRTRSDMRIHVNFATFLILHLYGLFFTDKRGMPLKNKRINLLSIASFSVIFLMKTFIPHTQSVIFFSTAICQKCHSYMPLMLISSFLPTRSDKILYLSAIFV